MEANEKKIIKDLFKELKTLHYQQKVIQDYFNRILMKLPPDTITEDQKTKFVNSDRKITDLDLKDLESRIDSLLNENTII